MSSRKYTILWIDDEPYYQESYADTILADERFHVIPVRSVQEALEKIADPGLTPDLLIWDMILPPGPLDRDETKGGLKTGAVLFRRFRDRFSSTPAILFTNVSDGDVHQLYHSPKNGSMVFRKADLLPEDLVVKIEDMLGIEHREPSDP